jgi:hypothetical protein
VPSSLLVRVVFGLLVLATLGAFVVTQELKSGPPLVQRVYYPAWISPNGDRRNETAPLRFDLPAPERVTVAVVNEAGEEVRRLADDRSLPAGTHRFTWDGRTDAGAVAPDGPYRLRVLLRRRGRAVTAPRTLTLDTSAPRPRLLRVSPSVLVPGSGRGVRIRYQGPSDPGPLVTVYRTRGARARAVERVRGPRFRRTAKWDGTIGGRPAAPGSYALSVTVRDPAGNAGSAPRARPPTPASALRRTGVTVRRLVVSGPLVPVRPGAVAGFALGGGRARTWTLRRIGTGRPLARGAIRRGRFGVRVPARARPGLHVLRVRGAGARAAAPLPVGGDAPRDRPLVVLPVVTWQARNPVDDDRDGFADTLPAARSVPSGRPWARGGLPPGVRAEAGPLLRFLDRERAAYELTTDLALAAGQGPALRGRRGVLVAGSARWTPRRLARGLPRWVQGGGRLASLSAGAFRREVRVSPGRLDAPSPPRPRDALGERTAPAPGAPGGMRVLRTGSLGLLSGVAALGPFARVEESRGLPRGARLLEAAGPRERPAFVAYRLGRGLVVRAGARGWSLALARDPDVRRVTRRTWARLRG